MAGSYNLWYAELDNPTSPELRQERGSEPGDLCGFWRIEGAKTKHDTPVSIYPFGEDQGGSQGDKIIFMIGLGRREGESLFNDFDHPDRTAEFMASTWLSCVAVKREDWSVAHDTGFWPDGKAARDMSTEQKMGIDIPAGENAPPVEESLADQIKNLAEELDKATEPTTQEEADKLTGKLDRMLALLKLAETEFEKEYRPHKKAADDVSAKWKKIGTPGRTAHDRAKDRRQEFLRKKQKALDDAAAEETRKRQEAARQQALLEAQAAAPADATPEAIERVVERAAASVAPVEAERATAGTSFGRSTGLARKKVGRIDDMVKFLTANAAHADIKEAAQKVSNKLAKAGVASEGMTIVEELK